MSAAAILKDPKIAIYRQRFDRSLRNLAWWRSSTFFTLIVRNACNNLPLYVRI